jgi:hypothetical protein
MHGSYLSTLNRGRILGRNPDKSLNFPPVIHSHLNSFALRFLLVQIHATFYSFYSSVTVQCTVKETGGKPVRKPYPLPYGLRNPYRNLKSENSQDYAQKSRRNWTFMNSASGSIWAKQIYQRNVLFSNSNFLHTTNPANVYTVFLWFASAENFQLGWHTHIVWL